MGVGGGGCVEEIVRGRGKFVCACFINTSANRLFYFLAPCFDNFGESKVARCQDVKKEENSSIKSP